MARRRKPVEPIPLDEIMNAPGMSGFVSFLNIPPSEGEEEESVPVAGSAIVVPTKYDVAEVESTIVETNKDVVYAPKAQFEASTLPARRDPSGFEGTKYPRPSKIRIVNTVYDSLSLGEAALYDALYRNAIPYEPGARAITIGYLRMADFARLAPRNCKLNCRALLQKRVIEEIRTYSYSEGRTYLVYEPAEAVRRQRSVGLTHIVRTRGVVFVDPLSGKELTRKQHLKP